MTSLTAARYHRQRSSGRIVRRMGLYGLLLILGIVFILPFVWMVSTSLKTDPQVYEIPPRVIPNPVRWANYPEILFGETWDWSVFLYNTLIRYAAPNVVGVLASSILVAYGFSRINWPGRDVLFFVCMATMMIPYQVTMIPLFIIFRKLKWVNTYLPLVIPAFFGVPYFIFMLRQFFLGIPEELSDAARIDGCSELGILVRIILPLSKPALAVVGLFQFMGVWNNYLGPLIYLNDREMWPISVALDGMRRLLFSRSVNVPHRYPYLMAINTVFVIPIILMFFLAQRTFIEGIAVTGLKG